MDELKAKITEVAQVLMGISCPIGLYDQIGGRIRMCADRLMDLAEPEEKPAEEKKEAKKPRRRISILPPSSIAKRRGIWTVMRSSLSA